MTIRVVPSGERAVRKLARVVADRVMSGSEDHPSGADGCKGAADAVNGPAGARATPAEGGVAVPRLPVAVASAVKTGFRATAQTAGVPAQDPGGHRPCRPPREAAAPTGCSLQSGVGAELPFEGRAKTGTGVIGSLTAVSLTGKLTRPQQASKRREGKALFRTWPSTRPPPTPMRPEAVG